MSITEYRAWNAAHGSWEPRHQRPEREDADKVMRELAAAFGETERELVRPLMARAAYSPDERADVVDSVRQAIAVVVTAAWRAARNSDRLADNLLFHEIALRWSPAYEAALNPAWRPEHMKEDTLQAALADIRAQGLRLGRLIALARREVKGWYRPFLTPKGWRVKPLRRPDETDRLALAGQVPERNTEYEERPDTVVAELAYNPVISGPRSVAVMTALEQIRLQLDVVAARTELVEMKAAVAKAKVEFDAVSKPHKKVAKPGAGRFKKNYIWEPAWSPDEVRALMALREARGPVKALEPVVAVLPKEGTVTIQTRMRQSTNRRWHAATFGPEHVGHTGTGIVANTRIWPSGVGEDGTRTWRRARLFRLADANETLAGFDIASSQYQILSIFLGDEVLERRLQTKSAHEIAADEVWPDDPRGPERAKLVTVAGGYGSAPPEIARNTGLDIDDVRAVLSALGDNIARFRAYTRKIAWAVPEYEGFTFEDPFDGSSVVWHPIRTTEREIRSNTAGEKYKLTTLEPVGKLNAEGRAPVKRQKLQQQIAPMLVHAMDSCFSGVVIEQLAQYGMAVVALFDCWLVSGNLVDLLEEVIREAGKPWLRSLSVIYDALLNPKYNIPKKDLAWMEDRAYAYSQRVAASERGEIPWPVFRTKPVELVESVYREFGPLMKER
jgi:hypothetical protein